jgi:N-acetyl-anhydromuramyl-L-alanine amidase AmpD
METTCLYEHNHNPQSIKPNLTLHREVKPNRDKEPLPLMGWSECVEACFHKPSGLLPFYLAQQDRLFRGEEGIVDIATVMDKIRLMGGSEHH